MYHPLVDTENEVLRSYLKEVREILRKDISNDEKIEQIKQAVR